MKDPVYLTVTKGYKTDYEYLSAKIHLKKLLSIKNYFVDVSIAKTFLKADKENI